MTKEALLKRGLLLEYITLGWNVVGTAIAIWAGLKTASLALFGFGIDSLIEILASVVVVWQLKAINKDNERLALKLIGTAFLLLSLYLLVRAVQVLLAHVHPQTSVIGGMWLFVTAVVMFALAYGKRKVGKQIPNVVLMEEAIVTVVDGLLAVAILLGVISNAFLGWWWADAVASLVLVVVGGREAMHIFQGEHTH
jgi:divalent metal cation (Fe/Co/Zn/Cd) transporter